jgi:hypothetical protein
MVVCEVLWLSLPKADAIIVFHDGEVHNITSATGDHVYVMNSFPDNSPTTINLLAGGQIGPPGGDMYDLMVWGTSIVNMFDNSSVQRNLIAHEESQVNIYGGDVEDMLEAGWNSRVYMYGGSVGYGLLSSSQGIMTIFGGSIGGDFPISPVLMEELSVTTIVGSNFEIDGTPVGYGTYTALDYALGNLTGTLSDGSPLNVSLYVYDSASLVLVPEPCRVLRDLEITGPNEVAEDFQAQYKAIAVYDNNSTKDVTDSADWSVGPNDIAAISAGLLTTTEIGSGQEDITILAQYTEGDVTADAEKPVTVFAVCPSGSALDFDGDDGVYVEGSAGEGSLLNIYNTDLTISSWVKIRGTTGTTIVARSKESHTAYRLGVSANRAFINIYRSGHWSLSTDEILTQDTWYYIVGVFDRAADTGRVYVNGAKEVEGSMTHDPLSNDAMTKIGCRNDIGDGAFDGIIDEVSIWNRALSAEEIRASMHVKASAGEPNLLGYWDFDEGEGQIVYDMSGNSNHGRLGSTAHADNADPAWVESDSPVGVCAMPVGIDIKPGGCPNPFNVVSRGVLPAAILGSEDFDVSLVDSASVQLAGVSAIRSSLEDVATPVLDGDECACSEDGPDSWPDLTLKFETRAILGAIGDVNDGDVLPLTLTGLLQDGTLIEGTDCVVIRGKHKPFNKGDINKDGIVNIVDFAIFAQNWLQSSIVDE